MYRHDSIFKSGKTIKWINSWIKKIYLAHHEFLPVVFSALNYYYTYCQRCFYVRNFDVKTLSWRFSSNTKNDQYSITVPIILCNFWQRKFRPEHSYVERFNHIYGRFNFLQLRLLVVLVSSYTINNMHIYIHVKRCRHQSLTQLQTRIKRQNNTLLHVKYTLKR